MKPETENDLAEVIAAASGPLAVKGGGTRGIAPQGDVLDVSGIRGVSLYEPGALTLVAAAGTPVADVEAALAAEHQRLAFEPMDHRGLMGTSGAPTIGGVIAGNISGPRRIQGGAARDFALGVRFVDGAGNIVKNGGRVMKNVTGYDLVKLMAGSWGTLGVLTEVALKVLPTPETQATLVLQGLNEVDAVRAMAAALGSPFEVSGASHLPEGADGGPTTMLRVEGFEASVTYRLTQLQMLLSGFGARVERADAASTVRIWADVRDVAAFHGIAGDVWRVSCKPSDGPALAARAQAQGCVFDWAGGLIWLRVSEGTDLRSRLGAFDGHATLVRGTAETRAKVPVFQPEASGVAKLTAGLRARFDPRGILNPGLMGSAA